ncbi:MAG: hypothetical protein LBD17_03545 [Endomicrobium sp.]|jgi:hypothetical protein|nr:hypothetical protein [Endomicrobium sp.]
MKKYFMLMVCFIICCCVICSCKHSKSSATKAPTIELVNPEEPNLPQKTGEQLNEHQTPTSAVKPEKFSASLKVGDKFTFEGDFTSDVSYNFILNRETIDGTKERIELNMPIVPWETNAMKNSTREIGNSEDGTTFFVCITRYEGKNNPCYFALFSGQDNSCVEAANNTPNAVAYGVAPSGVHAYIDDYILESNFITHTGIVHTYWLN